MSIELEARVRTTPPVTGDWLPVAAGDVVTLLAAPEAGSVRCRAQDGREGAVPAGTLELDVEQWLVLEHTAAPGLAGGVFAHPDFPQHVAFLRGLRERGVLVAAGPLPDAAGNGMAVVRVPDLTTALDVAHAAHTEDGAVRSGLLSVRVRPWRVMFT